MTGPRDDTGLGQRIIAGFRAWHRRYWDFEERHLAKVEWFQSRIVPLVFVGLAIWLALIMPEEFHVERLAVEHQGVPGTLVAREVGCGTTSCTTTGEWRSDDGAWVIADARLDAEHEPGTEIPTQAFPEAGRTTVYPLDYTGDPWMLPLTLAIGAGGVVALGYLVVGWASDIVDWRANAGHGRWRPVTFYLRARGPDVRAWTSRHRIPGLLQQGEGDWIAFSTMQRRGVLAGSRIGPWTALAELRSLAREPYLINKDKLYVLRDDGSVQRVKPFPDEPPWESDDRRVQRALLALPVPAKRLPRDLAPRAIRGAQWVLVPDADLDVFIGEVSGGNGAALGLATTGDEVGLALYKRGMLVDDWGWNHGHERVNDEHIPSGPDGQALRDYLDLTQTDVRDYAGLWPAHVDQDALAALLHAHGSPADLVEALIATLHLPEEEIRRLLLG